MVFVAEQEHKKRRQKKYAQHVANPPSEPQRREFRERSKTTHAQEADADRGADRGGEGGSEEDKAQYIAGLKEGVFAVGKFADQRGAQEVSENDASGKSEGKWNGAGDGEAHEKRPQKYTGPHAISPYQKSRQRDSRGKPNGSDRMVGGFRVQAQLSDNEVGDRHEGDDCDMGRCEIWAQVWQRRAQSFQEHIMLRCELWGRGHGFLCLRRAAARTMAFCRRHGKIARMRTALDSANELWCQAEIGTPVRTELRRAEFRGWRVSARRKRARFQSRKSPGFHLEIPQESSRAQCAAQAWHSHLAGEANSRRPG